MGPASRSLPADPTIADEGEEDDDDDDIRLELRERAKNSHDKSGNCAIGRNCDVNDEARGQASYRPSRTTTFDSILSSAARSY